MPLARNLQKTSLVLELMVRASSSSSSNGGGGEGEEAAPVATGLSQLLAREEGELLSLPVEVLHALARTWGDWWRHEAKWLAPRSLFLAPLMLML
jgi:hypothetical protein